MFHSLHVDVSRRRFLQSFGAAGVFSQSGWLPVLAADAARQGAKAKACIVLWMDGGPPHTDTFDLKPDVAECGIFKPIDSSLSGVQVSELLPKFARLMDRATLIRSMKTEENEHLRARMHLRTGYKDGQGGVSYPSLGSIHSAEIGEADFPLPQYVAIAERRDRSHGPGYLGTRHQPLYVLDPKKGVENLAANVTAPHFDGRLGLMNKLEQGFAKGYRTSLVNDHRTVYERSVAMMRSDKTAAFDLSKEPASVRERYGSSRFGDSCIMARRLIESGIKFVEVGLEGWDTHFENNDQIRKLCGWLDPGMSALVSDLEERGLLDSTLVVWMGEFGRTPKFKGKGRDHYAKAWSTMLMGGGVKRGQVIGRTDSTGATVEDRPVSVGDFFATVCQLMGTNPHKENLLNDGRPVSLVEKAGQPIKDVFA